MLGIRVVAALALALVLVAEPAPSFAQHSDSSHSSGGAEGPADLMFRPALDLAIWTMVVFLLLLFVLTKYAWKPLLQGLHKREESIASALEEAKLARAEAEKVRADFEIERKQRGQEIAKIMEQARLDAENLRQELRTRASEEIQTERARLRREIETAKDQALQEIWNQAVHLASAISARTIRRSLSDEDQKRLMDDALTEVSKVRERGTTELRQFGEEWVRQGGAG
jgi:F-type H+-transporting ATPase subunit b